MGRGARNGSAGLPGRRGWASLSTTITSHSRVSLDLGADVLAEDPREESVRVPPTMIFEAPCSRAASTITCAGSPIAQVDSPSTPPVASLSTARSRSPVRLQRACPGRGSGSGRVRTSRRRRRSQRRCRLVGDGWHLLGDDHDHLAAGGLYDLDRPVERPVGMLLAVVAHNDSLAHDASIACRRTYRGKA